MVIPFYPFDMSASRETATLGNAKDWSIQTSNCLLKTPKGHNCHGPKNKPKD
jgi:hypothetical protein